MESAKETDSQPVSITKAEINDLPLFRYEGDIHVVRTMEEARQVVSTLVQQPVLGFDTESRPAFKKGEHYLPSLVQFADHQATYLFQIGLFDGIEALKPILSSPEIKKVGVALHDDIKRLKKIAPFEDRGFVEITHLTRQLSITNTGLRSLAGILLGHRISKSAQVSNWAREKLAPNQLTYAATDAWVSRLLYEKSLAQLSLDEA
ncbi:MAG: 3'-5' exonuclease [Verrucomicrobiota bacterium]